MSGGGLRTRFAVSWHAIQKKTNRYQSRSVIGGRNGTGKSSIFDALISLAVFRSALRAASAEHGTSLHLGGDRTPVLAVDIQPVKQAFIQLQVADGESREEREDLREKMFRRACQNAQQRSLIGAMDRDGTQWLWLR
jgi:P-loop containing region of AAA domain